MSIRQWGEHPGGGSGGGGGGALGDTTITGSLTQSGGAVSLEGNATSGFSTTAGSLILKATGGAIAIDSALDLSVETIPEFSGNQDALELGSAVVARISSGANHNINGIKAPADGAPRLKMLTNVGASNYIFLSHEHSNAAVVDQILTMTGATERLEPNMAVWLWYDGTSQRWRQITPIVPNS